MFDKPQRVGDQLPQVNLAQRQRPLAGIVQQTAHGRRNAPCAFDALLNLRAPFAVGVFPVQLQVRQNPQQRIVDLVGRAQRELCQRSVLFVLGELRLELHLLFAQFALLLELLHQRPLRQIAFGFR